MTILEILNSIPDNAWNHARDLITLVGAAIAFVGVFYKLSHHSNESRKQREADLRKAVYFEASNSLAQMSLILGTLSEPGTKIPQDSNISAGLYKLHIVAKPPLIQKLVECGNYFGTAVNDIICDRLEIENLTMQCTHALDMHKTHTARFAELNGLYQGACPATLDLIRREQDDLAKKQAFCIEHHEKTIKERAQKQLDLCSKTMAHVAKFSNLMTNCVDDIRRDLENPFTAAESAQYKEIMRVSIEKMQCASADLIAKMRVKIGECDLPDL